MNITDITHEELSIPHLPSTIIKSYSAGQEYISIHLSVTESKADNNDEAPADEDMAPVKTFNCIYLSIVSLDHLTLADILRVIYEQKLWSYLTSDDLAALAIHFGVQDYNVLTADLVSARYTTADELAAHRKAVLGDTADFNELNDYVNACKALAKTAIASIMP